MADTEIGIRFVNNLQATAQGLTFEGCSVGIDASGSKMLNVIDTAATNTSVVVSAATTGSLVLENVIVDDSVSAVSLLLINDTVTMQEKHV